MSYGTNLAYFLNEKRISKKQSAEKIGVSINTLSNIINDRVNPSEETKIRIISFIEELGYNESDLLVDINFIKNSRIRTSTTLSGIEKSIVREALINIFKIIKKSDNNFTKWIDVFDIYDFRDNKGETITFYERRKILEKELQRNQEDLPRLISKLYKRFKYKKLYIGCHSPVVIKDFLVQIGIRVFFVNIDSEKISGFSTSLFSENTTDENIELEPVIVINRKVCNTVEKCFFEMAKQLFFMLKNKGYAFESFNKLEIENKEDETEAIQFAENIILPLEYLNVYLEQFCWASKAKNLSDVEKDILLNYYEFDYLVDCIKKDFYSSYKLVIKQLLKSESPYAKIFTDYEKTCSYYLESLKRHDDKYVDKTTFLNGEPNPLPTSFLGYDAFKMFIDESDE